jgi:polyhydroxyalkanoate synthesis regulator phasin
MFYKTKEYAMLKELLHVGLGSAVVLKEKIEEELKALQEKGKINSTDAKSFIESITKKGEEEDEKLKEKIKEMLKEAIEELGIATKKDIEELRSKLS